MGRMKWYKRDPNAALTGMLTLTLEERGAYNTILDLIYARQGNLANDERELCTWLGCNLRVWKRLRDRLVELGKIRIEDGWIINARADDEIAEAESFGKVTGKVSGNFGPNFGRSKGVDPAKSKGYDSHNNNQNKQPELPLLSDDNNDDEPPDDPPEISPEPPEIDLRKLVFDQGAHWLLANGIKGESAARGIVGKWRKQCGNDDAAILACMDRAGKDPPADPVTWMVKALQWEQENGKDSRRGGQGARQNGAGRGQGADGFSAALDRDIAAHRSAQPAREAGRSGVGDSRHDSDPPSAQIIALRS